MKKNEEIRKIIDAEVKSLWGGEALDDRMHIRYGMIYALLLSDIRPVEIASLIRVIFRGHLTNHSDPWKRFSHVPYPPISYSPIFSVLETKDDVVEFLKYSEVSYGYDNYHSHYKSFSSFPCDYNYIVEVSPGEFKRLIIDHKISLNGVKRSNFLAAVQPYGHIKWYLENTSPFHVVRTESIEQELKDIDEALRHNQLLKKAEYDELSDQFQKMNRCVEACRSKGAYRQEMEKNPEEFLEFLDEHIIKHPDDSAYLTNWNNVFIHADAIGAKIKLKEDQENRLNVLHAVIIQRLHNSAGAQEKKKFEEALLDVMPKITSLAKMDKPTVDSLQQFMDYTFTSQLSEMILIARIRSAPEFKEHAREWQKKLSQMVSTTVMNDKLKNRVHFTRAYVLDRMLGEKVIRQHMSRAWYFFTDSAIQKKLVEERLASCRQVRSVKDFLPIMVRQLIDLLYMQDSNQCKLRALHFAFTARHDNEIRRLLNERIQNLIDPGRVDFVHDSPDHSPQDYFRAIRKLMQNAWQEYINIPRDSKSQANALLRRERFKMITIMLNKEFNEIISFIQNPQFSQIASVLRKTENIHDQHLASLLEDMRNMSDDLQEIMPQQRQAASSSNSHAASAASGEKDHKHTPHNP